MDNLITALSIIWSWEIYLFTLIALLAYTPLSLEVSLVSPFEKTPGQFFGYPFLGMILQSIATIFLFISVYIYFYEDLNFIETIIESILITFGKNGVSSALFLFIINFILLIADGTNNFRFIIGIFVFNTILGINDSFIPLIPDVFTLSLILVMVFLNINLTPFLLFPINKVFGKKESDIFSDTYAPSLVESWFLNASSEFFGLVPALIYLNWMMNL